MLFSVITVCLNAQNSIEKTVLSVLQQKYDDFEYIIMDGGSTDKTLEIIHHINSERTIKCYSENDTGIYNAMNKAAELAKGDYVIYLNSGDRFHNQWVLSKTDHFLKEHPADIIYGNVVIENAAEKKKITYYHRSRKLSKYYLLHQTICHQSIFAKRSLLLAEKFDENYLYWADQEWIMRCIAAKKEIAGMNWTICNYDGSGISSDPANLKYIQTESDRILKHYVPFVWACVYPLKKTKRLLESAESTFIKWREKK